MQHKRNVLNNDEILLLFKNPPNYLFHLFIFNIFIYFSWQPESKFFFSQIRLPPETIVQSPVMFQEGMEVEVFSRSNEKEECGWWAAAIKMMKGDFLVVEYLGWDSSYTEIVSQDRLRMKNANLPVSNKTFFRFEIVVPEDLRE